MMKKMTEIEEVKAEIKVLEKKLSFLEEIEKQPRMNLQQEGEYAVVSYHDKVYYRLMNETTFSWYKRIVVIPSFPTPTLVMVEDAETERLLEGLYYNYIQVKKGKVVEEPEDNEWKSVALRFGEKLSDIGPCGYYDFSPGEWVEWALNAYEKTADDWLSLLKKEKEQRVKDAVRESVKWCEEHPNENPLDWLKPQTPEQVADGLKEAFREAVKQGIIPEIKQPTDELIDKLTKKPPEFLKFELGQTLYDVCMTWWGRVFDNNDDMETCIDDLVDNIDYWLPKEQSAAGSQSLGVEDMVEGFNDCLKKIKGKLR